ncbi:hypothetical protein G3T14_11735 [Methylobacterium sp. BTF04]|uniref:hypothetical protein n=1 Tax=Methylobacterium sp. BTF04 TaxID=2708300 RepID=UPI0013CF46C4|nr:hypothetical protein [Methylobacterium sp. BTF04]NEU12803.1 hypothetical protein [Methylobacterium sp. BTF04]
MAHDTIAKVRLSERRKSTYLAAAGQVGGNLSAFMRRACDQAVMGVDPITTRADLTALRRYANAVASVANDAADGGLSREDARRLGQAAAAMQAILSRHLSVG